MEFDPIGDRAERQAALISALTSTPAEAEPDPREQLERAVAELDRALARVEAVEPAPDVLTAALSSKAAQRQALADAVLGRRTVTPAATGPVPLDGGARITPERPETHAETLARVLRDRSADVGASF
jgi:hypothetical protein